MDKTNRPATYHVYYTSMKDYYANERETLLNEVDILEDTINSIKQSITDSKIENIKETFKLDLNNYEEFKSNTYINGKFERVAKSAYMNRNNNYELVSDLFDVYNLARKQKEIYDIKNKISLYNKIIGLTEKEYLKILRTFYYEVHKQMILKGYGYSFEGQLGWICITRKELNNKGKALDWAATKHKKEQLKKEGKKLYTKEEAAWCKKYGIDYNAEDYRVYLKHEFFYDISLLECTIPKGNSYKLVSANYRGIEIKDKTNDELAEMCNNDLEKICNLSVDIKTKVNMCVKINEALYTNFIRYENKKSNNNAKTCRQNR